MNTSSFWIALLLIACCYLTLAVMALVGMLMRGSSSSRRAAKGFYLGLGPRPEASPPSRSRASAA